VDQGRFLSGLGVEGYLAEQPMGETMESESPRQPEKSTYNHEPHPGMLNLPGSC